MPSLIEVVEEESLEPSRLMISFLSRRERPFLVGGVLLGLGDGAAGAGLAEVVVFFFLFPATWAQVPEGAEGAGAGAFGARGTGGGWGVGSGVDPEAFGGRGPVREIGSRPLICLLVILGMGDRRGSS
jgi:hypothetical protein